MNKISLFIFTLLYNIVFFVFSIYLASTLVIPRLKSRYLWFLAVNRGDFSYIQKLSWKKVPNHLGLVVNENDVKSYLQEISQLLCWCAAVGIKTITLYDEKGILKKDINKVREHILQHKVNYFGVQNSSYTFNVFTLTPSTSIQTEAPILNSKDFDVIVCSLEDSRWDMINFTRNFCKSVKENLLTPSDLTAEMIQNNLALGDRAEPELLLVCGGSQLILRGYFPWQIRLSEMTHISLKNISCSAFTSALDAFATTEQRFGK